MIGFPSKSIFTKNFKRIFLILVLLVIALAPSYYFYNKYQETKTQTKANSQEDEMLVEKVGRLIELPNDEQPTIATVSDKSKLSNQPFFAKVENGDRVLIYAQARKAYLYRPSTNKIIEVAPINIGNNAGSSSATVSSPTATPILTPTVTPTP